MGVTLQSLSFLLSYPEFLLAAVCFLAISYLRRRRRHAVPVPVSWPVVGMLPFVVANLGHLLDAAGALRELGCTFMFRGPCMARRRRRLPRHVRPGRPPPLPRRQPRQLRQGARLRRDVRRRRRRPPRRRRRVVGAAATPRLQHLLLRRVPVVRDLHRREAGAAAARPVPGTRRRRRSGGGDGGGVHEVLARRVVRRGVRGGHRLSVGGERGGAVPGVRGGDEGRRRGGDVPAHRAGEALEADEVAQRRRRAEARRRQGGARRVRLPRDRQPQEILPAAARRRRRRRTRLSLHVHGFSPRRLHDRRAARPFSPRRRRRLHVRCQGPDCRRPHLAHVHARHAPARRGQDPRRAHLPPPSPQRRRTRGVRRRGATIGDVPARGGAGDAAAVPAGAVRGEGGEGRRRAPGWHGGEEGDTCRVLHLRDGEGGGDLGRRLPVVPAGAVADRCRRRRWQGPARAELQVRRVQHRAEALPRKGPRDHQHQDCGGSGGVQLQGGARRRRPCGGAQGLGGVSHQEWTHG